MKINQGEDMGIGFFTGFRKKSEEMGIEEGEIGNQEDREKIERRQREDREKIERRQKKGQRHVPMEAKGGESEGRQEAER